MKARELRGLSTEELLRELEERMQELFNLRMQAQTERGQVPPQVRRVKREVSRIRTVLAERELGIR